MRTWHTAAMDVEQWWRKLSASSPEWLIENNGDVVPVEIAAEIADAAGSIDDDAWRVGNSEPSGFYFSDDAVDWIEAVSDSEQLRDRKPLQLRRRVRLRHAVGPDAHHSSMPSGSLMIGTHALNCSDLCGLSGPALVVSLGRFAGGSWPFGRGRSCDRGPRPDVSPLRRRRLGRPGDLFLRSVGLSDRVRR